MSREKVVAKWLEEYYPKHGSTSAGHVIIPRVAREQYREEAKKLIALIVDEDAELPQYNFAGTPTYFESGYNIAQQDMWNENWRKVSDR